MTSTKELVETVRAGHARWAAWVKRIGEGSFCFSGECGDCDRCYRRMGVTPRKVGAAIDALAARVEALEGVAAAVRTHGDRLVSCLVTMPACVAETGDFCGEEPCDHGDGQDEICADCGDGGGLHPTAHDSECPKLPGLWAIHDALRTLDDQGDV